MKTIEVLSISKIETLFQNIDIFIARSKICRQVSAVLTRNSLSMYIVSLNSSFKDMTIFEYAQKNKNHKIWNVYDKLGLNKKQKKESRGIFHFFLYQNIYNQLKIPYVFDKNENLFEYEYFIKIEHIMKYPILKQKISSALNLLKGLQ